MIRDICQAAVSYTSKDQEFSTDAREDLLFELASALHAAVCDLQEPHSVVCTLKMFLMSSEHKNNPKIRVVSNLLHTNLTPFSAASFYEILCYISPVVTHYVPFQRFIIKSFLNENS